MSALMQAADTRYLWYLGSPSLPVPIGELRLLVQSRGACRHRQRNTCRIPAGRYPPWQTWITSMCLPNKS